QWQDQLGFFGGQGPGPALPATMRLNYGDQPNSGNSY
ncbi:MAG: hypothetical protein ACI8Z1_003653, partial [Candidatus Azotimanducaceae bacterium]